MSLVPRRPARVQDRRRVYARIVAAPLPILLVTRHGKEQRRSNRRVVASLVKRSWSAGALQGTERHATGKRRTPLERSLATLKSFAYAELCSRDRRGPMHGFDAIEEGRSHEWGSCGCRRLDSVKCWTGELANGKRWTWRHLPLVHLGSAWFGSSWIRRRGGMRTLARSLSMTAS